MSFHAGFVGLIGLPNAGKSTLMNLMVEEKVSIVTPKPQTTRRRILGLVNRPNAQIVWVDAPGVLKADKGLNAFLQREAEDVIQQSDALVAVLSVDTDRKEHVIDILNLVNESKKPWVALITKVDNVQLGRRITMIKDECAKHKSCQGVIEISNQWKKNEIKEPLEQLNQWCEKVLPESKHPLYDVELFTPHTVRELVTEIIREQCFDSLQQEIPYNIAVRISKFDESNPDLPKIYAEILVSREGQKPIVVGKGGAVIKEIGMKSRKEIEKVVGTKVFLSLEVSVREDWFLNKGLMKELGYVVE